MKDGEKVYQDKVIGAEFLEFLRERLILAKEILADDGSIYINIDKKKGHYVKILLDEVFGENNFFNEIVWGYRTGGISKTFFARKHDSIFFYAKNSTTNIFNTQYYKSYQQKKYNFKGVDDVLDEEKIMMYPHFNKPQIFD